MATPWPRRKRRTAQRATAARKALCGAWAVLLAVGAGTAAAQDAPAAEPRTWLQLHGTYGNWRMTTEGSDLFSFSDPTPLQSEAELGLKKQHAYSGIALGRRIGQNWRIELDRTASKRSGSVVLASDLSSNGRAFARGTTLNTSISLTTLRINGGWSLLHTAEQEAGISVGGQWLSVSRHLDGQQRLDTGSLAPLSIHGSDLAPIAVLGAYGSFKLGGAWRLNGRLDFDVGSGSHQELQVAAHWQATPNLALQAGYRATRTDVDLLFGFIACCSRVKVDYRVHGPSLGLELAF